MFYIPDGATITLDGDAGVVTLVSHATEVAVTEMAEA